MSRLFVMPITLKLAFRDIAVILAAIALWQFSHQLDAGGAGGRIPVAILAGIMIPVAGFLAHEWGHLIGAWAGGSTVHMPRSVFTLFLFDYQPAENSRAQFLRLSCGGFIASGLVVVLLLAVLSLDHLADQIALGLTLLGVIATFVIELPPAWRVYKGGPLPE
jgi:F0F1-type ATP synthase assembly protein I